MSLPNARKITIEGTGYEFLVKDPHKDRYGLGWTGPSLKLTVLGGGKLLQFDLESKLWTKDHATMFFDEPSYASAPPHKVPFGPKEVAETVKQGTLGEEFDLENWRVRRTKMVNKD